MPRRCRIRQCQEGTIRHRATGRDLRHREIRFASASAFPACRFFFVILAARVSLFSNREKARERNCPQLVRASKTCTRENPPRKNTLVKKCGSRL